MATQAGAQSNSILRIAFLLIQFFLGAMVLILGAAFIMRLLGANSSSSFAAWIYDKAEGIMVPFSGIFDPIQVTAGTAIETSLLFAMLVYAVLAAAVGAIAQKLS